jgi:hypothetical protein
MTGFRAALTATSDAEVGGSVSRSRGQLVGAGATRWRLWLGRRAVCGNGDHEAWSFPSPVLRNRKSSPAAGLTTGRPPRCSRRASRPPDDEPSRRIRAPSSYRQSPQAATSRQLSAGTGDNQRSSKRMYELGRLSSPRKVGVHTSQADRPQLAATGPRSLGEGRATPASTRLVCGEGVGGAVSSYFRERVFSEVVGVIRSAGHHLARLLRQSQQKRAERQSTRPWR